MRKSFLLVVLLLSISFHIFGTPSVPLYLWTTNSAGSSMSATQLLSEGRSTSIKISSNSNLYMAGAAIFDSVLLPSLLIANLDGSSLQAIQLTDNGTSFTEGSAYGVATGSQVYLVGTVNDPSLPYFWTASLDGSSLQGVELTNNGSSFDSGNAYDIALSLSSNVYMVGSGDDTPYLWRANTDGSSIQAIELTNNGVSFSSGHAYGVVVSSSNQVYIVGEGDSQAYLWIVNADGSSIEAIELTNNGNSFSSAVASRIALSSDEKLYIVGAGTLSCSGLPYLWVRDVNGAVEGTFLTNNGVPFTFGKALDVAVSLDGLAYIVGFGSNSPLASYLWVRNANGSINAISLTDNNGAIVGTAGAVTLYYPGFQSIDLVNALKKYGNVHILQGNASSGTVSAPTVYIVSGFPPVG